VVAVVSLTPSHTQAYVAAHKHHTHAQEYRGGRPRRLESDSYLAQDAPEHLSRPSSEADIDPYLINAMPNAVRVHASPPLPSKTTIKPRSTIRLLESGAGTLSAEFLGLAAAGIGDKEGAVEGDEGGLELVLGVLIDVLGVVRDLGFRMLVSGLSRRKAERSAWRG